ncbi:MAG: replication and repair protein RecF [Pseudomonadota bacterium]|jgi:DNA replication and repair protein RecF
MPIQRLAVHQLRNLTGVDIHPCPHLNFFFGDNGSGKTSLLEAISVLAHGRSFRTHKHKHLVNYSATDFSVFSELDESAGFAKLGVNRGQGEASFKLNGTPVYSSASLAAQLPTQIMDAHSFRLLEGPSKVRRQLFDWLVFHVKHEFASLWKDYARCVKHRNSLLRHDRIARPDLLPWDIELVRLAEALHEHRLACLAPYLDVVQGLLVEGGLPPELDIQFEYHPGWDTNNSLMEQLEAQLWRDKKYGFTTLGAHKSELKITARKMAAHEILSRGQQKTLIAALFIAQIKVFQTLSGRACVLLIDDVPAELDKQHINLLGRWVNELNVQVFATGIELASLIEAWPLDTKSKKVFHVKHGEVNEQPV